MVEDALSRKDGMLRHYVVLFILQTQLGNIIKGRVEE